MKIFQFTLVVLLLTSVLATSSEQALQQFFNGLFQQNQLDNPTTILSCLNQDQTELTYDYISNFINEAAETTSDDLSDLAADIFKSLLYVPESAGDCIIQNSELLELSQEYEVLDKELSVENSVFYFRYNWPETRNFAQQLQAFWQSEQYEQAGVSLGSFMHLVL